MRRTTYIKNFLAKSILLVSLLLFQYIAKSQCTVNAGNDTTICLNASLSLFATTTGGTDSSFTWTTIPLSTATIGNLINIQGSTTGTFTYVVTADLKGGCTAKDTIVVTVDPLPTASFTANPNGQCGSVPINFTNTSSGIGLSYSWNFGDPNSGPANISSATNPSHHFVGTPGTGTLDFTVTLIVTSSGGCKDTVTHLVTIKQSPGTELGGTGFVIYNGLKYFTTCSTSSSAVFNFTNQSSTTATNVNYTIIWGDASPNFTAPAFGVTSHTYSTGTYTLSFVVTGGAPNSCTDTATYYVFVGSNPAVGLNNPGNTTVCSGAPLTFPISGTFTNPPGTTYTATFNDGSAPVILTHPPPPGVSHAFDISSCGTNSSDGTNIYSNSFSAVIVASNPCGTSSSGVVPIYVSQKPEASFTISPNDTVCTNNLVTFTNTSEGNSVQNNGICLNGKGIWSVTPATGWTISSGILGNDFGLSDPTLWLAGSNILRLNFTSTGTYTIKFKAGGSTWCTNDSTEKTICVNAVPVAAFNVNQNIGCAPFTVNTTNNSSLSNCGNNTYSWSVTYVPTTGCSPASPGFTYINSTSAISQNPQYQFTNPGVYTIRLITIAPASACSSAVATQQITVKSRPEINLTVPPTVCEGQSINPSVASSCYITNATYAWSFPSGTPSTAASQNPGSVIYNNAGTFNVSVDVTNECGTATATQPVTVVTVTPANAGPGQNICGTVATMAGNTPVTGTGLWSYVSGPAGSVITAASSPTTNITGLVPGTYVFQWKITNGTCSSSSNVTIIISTGPTPAAAGPDQSLCLSASTTLAANTPLIGTGAWSYVSGPAGYNITNTSSPATTVTGLMPGVYIFRWTTSFSNCTPGTDDVQITIYDSPTLSAAGTDQAICSSTVTMNGNVPIIGNGIWTTVSGPNSPLITTASSPSTTITGLIAGTYIFKWTINNGVCPPSEDNVQVIVTAVATTAAAGPDQTVCAATTITLAGNTAIVGTGVWSYISGPAGYIITDPSSPATSVTGLIPGTYIFQWTITNGVCPPTTDQVQVTIDANATIANAGPGQNICGTVATMAGNTPVTGTGLWSYVSGPAASVITNPSSPITTITNLTTGTYVFQWTITNGTCSSSSTVTIIISAGPTPAAAGPDQSLCLANSITLAANAPVIGTGAWSYISGPAGYNIINTSSPTTTVTGLIPGTYIFHWTTSFSNCTPSTDDVQIIVYDNPTPSAAGTDQTICSDIVTMAGNVPTIGNGIWTTVSGPNSPLITTASSPLTTITGLMPGTYIFKWAISNGVCPPSEDLVQVIVTAIATTAIAGPDQTVCAATTITLAGNTAVVGTGVWSYISGPAGYTITDPASPSTTVTGLILGTYIFQWTITNGVCPPTTDQVQVTIDANATIANAGPGQNICGTVATMAGNTPVTGTGLWSYVSGPAGSVIANPSFPTTTITNLTTGTYVFQWTITNGTCSSSSNVTIIISAGPTPAAAGPDQSLCLATSTTLAANTVIVGTGIWTNVSGPAGYNITNTSSPTTTVTGLIPGVYIFRWTTSFSNCTPGTDDVQITIYDNPTPSAAGTDQTICSDAVTMAGNVPVIGNGIWTTVSGPNTPVITTASSPSTTITGLIPGTYTFKWTISNGVCPPSEDLVQVIVTAVATTAAAGPDQTVCAATTTTLAGNTAIVGTGVWSYISGPAGYIITDPSSPATTITGLIPGTYIFQWTITNGVCPPTTDQVQINNLNNLQNQISAAVITICSGQPVTITGDNPTGGTGTYTYQWEQSTDGISWTDILSATLQNHATTLTASMYFRRKVTSDPCETYSNIIFITVQASVATNTISANQNICINTAPATITGSLPTGGNGVYVYAWEQSTDGVNWLTITGAVNFDYNPGVLTQTTLYRRIVSTTICSGPQSNISNVVTITVNLDSKALFEANPTIRCAPFDLGTAIIVAPFPGRNGLYQWFADGAPIGNNTTGIFPGYTMNTPGDTVIIKLVTSSQFGCKADSMEIPFVTVTIAMANFTKTPLNGCGPLAVTFTNTSSILNNTVQYFWNFGNRTLLNTTNPGPVTASYSKSPNFIDTTYYITLKAFNGCDTTIHRDSIKVFPDSKARFAVDTTRGCSPFTLHITNTSPGNNFAYYWDFGDGFSDTTHSLGSFTHTYNTGAITTYTIRLISQNQCTRDTQMITLVVSPNLIQPFVTANGNQLSGCAPHVVTFNNSTVGAAQLTWNFGDNSPVVITPNNQNTIIHQYNNPGVYTVNIHLQNDCSDTLIQRTITVFATPVADFSAAPSRICTNQPVTVINNSANANSYEWFWGDASSSTFTSGQHIYNSSGLYTITLVAKRVNPSGFMCTDTIRKQITVVDKVPAQITVDAGKRCAPYTLNVNAGNISGYSLVEWVIYDSSSTAGEFHLTGLSASHVYNVAGTYSVKLVVHTTAGCVDSSTYQFQVFSSPKTTFGPKLISTCSHDTTVNFTALTTSNDNASLTYKWFINGSIAGISNPFSYHFQAALNNPAPSEFTVQALAENAAGCGDTSLAGKVVIQPLPFTFIKVSPSLVQSQPFYEFTFTDTVAANPNKTYMWDMGVGATIRNGREVTYEYGDVGRYKVRLFVTDFTTGCKAKDSVNVTILYVPGSLYVPNAFYPNSKKNELKTFLPAAIGLEKYHLQIFDTWGKMIFETKELNPDGSPKVAWDGTYSGIPAQGNGKPLSQDAYVWKIVEAKFKNGKDWEGMSYNGGAPRRFGTLTVFR